MESGCTFQVLHIVVQTLPLVIGCLLPLQMEPEWLAVLLLYMPSTLLVERLLATLLSLKHGPPQSSNEMQAS